MKRLAIIAATCLALTGCATITADLQKVAAWNQKYLPIIGKDLLLVGQIIVQAECSPLAATGSQITANVLNIVAPNATATKTVTNILQTNMAITSQICPLVASIKATVGAVPAGTPTQTVPAPAATPAS